MFRCPSSEPLLIHWDLFWATRLEVTTSGEIALCGLALVAEMLAEAELGLIRAE
jgi:hypothetical protein